MVLFIQPENIMLVDPTNGAIKLIDFGVARKVGGTKGVTVMVGTPEFAGWQKKCNILYGYLFTTAPEVLKYDPVTTAADMW